MARWWLPSLLVIDRTRAISFMTLAVCSQPSAIEMPGTAVSIALVVAAVLGAGLGVERLELAGPAGHPEQDAGHLPLPQLVGLQGHQVGEADRPTAPRPPAQADAPEEPGGSSTPSPAHRHLDDRLLDLHRPSSLVTIARCRTDVGHRLLRSPQRRD